MKQFEKYMELKELCKDKEYNQIALSQYLHIAQVMSREEDSYRKHKQYMLEWLNNIEQSVKDSIVEKKSV